MTPNQAFTIIKSFYEVEVENRHLQFIDDEQVNDTAWQLANILTAEKPKFGVLLCGDCGNGKTTYLYALQNIINWLRDGHYLEDEENSYMKILGAKELAFMARNNYQEFLKECRYTKILAIDDLGEEPHEVLDYGNIQNPILELIEYRYDNQFPTFMTSNLDPAEITEKYGDRIADRLCEMVDRIVFTRKMDQSYRRV